MANRWIYLCILKVVICFAHEDGKFLTQTIETGDGTSFKIESYGMPFVIDQPKPGSIHVKFGDSDHHGRESISFYQGSAYIWILNQGGAVMTRRTQGKCVIISVRKCSGCSVESVTTSSLEPVTQSPQIVQPASQQVQVSPSVMSQEIPLDEDHTFKVESKVDFKVYRKPNRCVDVIIGQPMRQGYSNHMLSYVGFLLNVTNYSRERVQFSSDSRRALCSVGVASSISSTTTTTTTRTTTTTTSTTLAPLNDNEIYSDTVPLEHGYEIKLQSTIQFRVTQPTRFTVKIVIGSESPGSSVRGNYVLGEYLVEIVNYSSEQIEMSSRGKSAQCTIGDLELEVTEKPVSQGCAGSGVRCTNSNGIQTQTYELIDGRTLEVLSKEPFTVSNVEGQSITITIGDSYGSNGKSESTFRSGDYLIIVINHTSNFVMLESRNEQLRCYIGIHPN